MNWFKERGDVDRESFVETVILQDTKARQLNTRKWSEIQKSHPGAEYEEFKEWSSKIWAQWARFKLKVFKKRKNLQRYANTQNQHIPNVDVELEPADMAVAQPSPISPETPRQTTPVQKAATDPSPSTMLTLMSPLNHLSLSTTSNSKRSSECIDSPESADEHKHRRLALSFFQYLGDQIREGIVTPGEVMQFCSRYDGPETEMNGLLYDRDARESVDNAGAEEADLGGYDDELMAEAFHPGMDLTVGDSISHPSPLNHTPSREIASPHSTLSLCSTPSPWTSPAANFDLPRQYVDPTEIVTSRSNLSQSVESHSEDSDDSQQALSQTLESDEMDEDEEDKESEYEEDEVDEEDEDDEEDEEDEEDEVDDEDEDEDDEDWKSNEEDDNGGGKAELDKLEVGGHHLMAAEQAKGVDGTGLGNPAPDNRTPSEPLGDEFNGSPNSNEKTATEPTEPTEPTCTSHLS